MRSDIDIKAFIQSLPANEFVRSQNIPLGYAAGLPTVKNVGDKVLLQVPYWKCKVTGVKNQNLIFPIRYVLFFSLPDLQPIKCIDLKNEKKFKTIDFEKPIGIFPHKSLIGMNRSTYFKLKDQYYAELKKLIISINDNVQSSFSDNLDVLFTNLLEPALLPIYCIINNDFVQNHYKRHSD